MSKIKENIPNFITCLNLFAGLLAIIAVLQSNYIGAFWLVIFSATLDFLDGMLARLLSAYSPIGKELDSLADAVSFGAAPSIMMAAIIAKAMGTNLIISPDLKPFPFYLFGLLIGVFSAIRLARFNIDKRDSDFFRGLPTPANAILVASLYVIAGADCPAFMGQCFTNPYLLIAMTFILCYLLISPLRLFSMKFKNLSWPDNKYRYILIIISLISAIILGYKSVPLMILAYFVLSFISNTLTQKEHEVSREHQHHAEKGNS